MNQLKQLIFPRPIKTFLKRPGKKGQSMVELAITLTSIMILLAGAFDLGSAFFDYIALRDGAQEGALYGSVDPNNTNVVQHIQASSSNKQPVDFSSFSLITDCTSRPDIGICISYSDTPPCSGGYITVDLYYPYRLTMPFIGGFIGDQFIHLHAKVTNVILRPMCAE